MGSAVQTNNTKSAAVDKPHFLTGWQFRLHRLSDLWRVWQIARDVYPSLSDAWTAVRRLYGMVRDNARYRHIAKGLTANGRFYTLMGLPGSPSPALDTFIKNELHRVLPIEGYTRGLMLIFLAITKKCPLRCAHCFEWDALNKQDVLRVDDLVTIVRKFQERGLSVLEFSGGEPLIRFNDLLAVLRQCDTRETDFWVLTSGYQLTAEKAQQLKAAGLAGVSISIDHWDAAEHDRFRGIEGSFDRATRAARHTREAGLLLGLSLVPTRSFCTLDNLQRYATLGRNLGAHFIRLVEPKAVGHWEGQEVELTQHELDILEAFTQKMQTEKAWRDYPIIEHNSTFQRKVGCGGGGNRYLYIDTDGDIHACPFCRHKCASALTGTVEAGLQALKNASGCHAYHNV